MVQLTSQSYGINADEQEGILKYLIAGGDLSLYGLSKANRKIAESLSDTLIEYQKIQKWDGKLPTVSGSNALVSIDPAE